MTIINESEGDKNNEIETKKRIVPPDGGWGWMIVLGFALNSIIMVPSVSAMGIAFTDLFPAYNISPTEETIILSTNMSFGMLMGLTHGPLLRKFGFRKIAILGALCFSGGIIITSFATSFTHYMISHGILTSFGIGLGMAAFSLAINTYFLEKRGRAMGVAMTFTGLGPILMPQLISALINSYSSKGTIIILGGIALHTVCASLLLQPVKWHAKRSVNEPQEPMKTIGNGEDNSQESANERETEVKYLNSNVQLNGHYKNEDVLVVEIKPGTNESEKINNHHNLLISDTIEDGALLHSQSDHNILRKYEKDRPTTEKYKKWCDSGQSLESVHLGSCLIIYDELMMHKKKGGPLIQSIDDINVSNEKQDIGETQKRVEDQKCEKKSKKCNSHLTKLFNRIVKLFDLTLLCDPIYVNMMLGISIATVAETNFAILTPFILHEMTFSNGEVATVMSVMGAVDLLMRGFAPYVGEWLRQTPRMLYLVSLIMLIISRTILIIYTDFVAVILMAIGIGFAKGFRSVFMSLVIPSYIPIERLPHASGIQIFVNGFLLMVLGPIIGILRESKGSYRPYVILINCMTGLTIVMWLTEICITKRSNNKQKKDNEEHSYEIVAAADE